MLAGELATAIISHTYLQLSRAGLVYRNTDNVLTASATMS